MPVHEIKYKAWEGDVAGEFRRLIAIPKFSLMSIFNKWLAVSLFGVGSLMTIVFTLTVIITCNPEIQKLMNLGFRELTRLN
ncbi:hypothetical protein IT570_14510, partial [Candidatus Sumerlaeota bacterium]|nr:hypothetical protein [Candidatus Sumerlaeota bacterium]